MSSEKRSSNAAGSCKLTRPQQVATCLLHILLLLLLPSIGGRASRLAELADAGQPANCEPIEKGLCGAMPYQSTRMPNFFKDANQFEALERASQYELLVNSKCSAHVHEYICELLVPVCLESREAMRRFEIYPCRSFCRQVRRECEAEIRQSPSAVLPGFNCDKLPFESNGGNGTQHGPCHQLPELAPPAPAPATSISTSQRATSSYGSAYRPYQPALETNMPPFITDTSRIDASIIRPHLDVPARRLPGPSQAGELAERSLWDQAKAFGQQLAWTLIRYSNALSVATVIFLLLVLVLRRLNVLKPRSMLAHGEQRATGPGRPGSFGVSPSSSSRSLMLIAGSNGKQPPCHKLVSDTEPSHKLLQALGHSQPTLVNVNHHQGNQESRTMDNHNRYLMMHQHHNQQQQHQQQVFSNTLDSQSSCHSNQYDYIQVEPRNHPVPFRSTDQVQAGKQMFSNILLSSPSHQVLLLDAEPPNRVRTGGSQPPPPPPATPRQSQLGSGYNASPYASGELCGLNQRSFSRRTRRELDGSLRTQLNTPTNSSSSQFNPNRASARNRTGASSGSSSSGSSQSSSAALVSPPGRLLQ